MRTHLIPAVASAALFVALAAAPTPAHAFCGFYINGAGAEMFNDATLVVLMREGTRTVLSMQNNYKGPPESFAMVIPVPMVLSEDNVKTLPEEIFDRVDKLAAPRLVEYWEMDPCEVEPPTDKFMMPMAAGARGTGGLSGGGGLGVTVEAEFVVGEYEIVILSAKDSTGLDTWIRLNGYKIPAGAEPVLRPYVAAGMKFFVAKVDVKKVKFVKGRAKLSPLRFFYDSDEFSLPVRLGLLNSSGAQDLLIHILARGKRYEVANYDNVTIPTNIDVSDETRDAFPAFYAALLDETMARNPKAVVTEYSWDASGCDPCPTPALNPSEIASLGSDVLDVPMGLGKYPGAGKGVTGGIGKGGPAPWMGGFVLTRLHARYTKESLGEDLIFKEAEAIVGGREFLRDDGKELEHGAKPSSMNAFQGRYAIRHAWAGPIECKDPIRGRWGGPPDDRDAKPAAKPALDTAFAPRGDVKLASYVRSGVPELEIKGAGAGVPAGPGEAPTAGADTGDDAKSAAPAHRSDDEKAADKVVDESCAIRAPGSSSGSASGSWLVLVLALVVAGLRRRHHS